jgi:hypothetical protein
MSDKKKTVKTVAYVDVRNCTKVTESLNTIYFYFENTGERNVSLFV